MIILLLIALLTGAVHIHSEYQKNYRLIYIFKPLTLLIILFAVYQYSAKNDYAWWILAGLVFSMFGDIFLMLKAQKFIQGLVSFLLAHLLYIGGFFQQLEQPTLSLSLVAFCLPALAYYGFLYPTLGKLKAPVLVYVSAIVLMAYFSFAVYQTEGGVLALSAFIGALLFMLSDALLALNKFYRPVKSAQLLILSTYYLAQCCIAYSTLTLPHPMS